MFWSAFVAGSPHCDPNARGRLLTQARDHGTFLWAALGSPRQVGALAPSSGDLARAIARASGRHAELVELGAGTGSITRALLDHLPAHGRLLALETDRALREGLQSRLVDDRLRLSGAHPQPHCTLGHPMATASQFGAALEGGAEDVEDLRWDLGQALSRSH